MKLTAESTVVNDAKINTDIDGAQTTADNAQSTANTATTKADNAQGTANTALTKADNAQATANSAKSVADNTAQYFWFKSSGSDTGAHISEKTQAQFEANPSGGNLLARSNGIAVRDGTEELATFGANGAQVGTQGGYHTNVDADSVSMTGKESEQLWIVQASGTAQTRTSRLTGFSVESTSGTAITETKTAEVDISTWSTARTLTISTTDTVSGSASATRSVSKSSTAISTVSLYSGRVVVSFTINGNKLVINMSVTTASTGGTFALTSVDIKQSVSLQLPKMNFYGNNNVLWEASALTYPLNADVITLAEPISAQPSGILLLWGYNGGKNSINTQFIPKYCAMNTGFSGYPSGEICSATRNYPAYKQISIVSDTQIKGHDTNSQDGVSSFDNLHYYNSRWGLIAVLGV